MDKAIISNIYELAKEKYGEKQFSFEQLWKDLVKKLKLDKDEQAQVGHVYTSMLQDHRFIFVGGDKWQLREFLTLAQQENLANALYNFKQEESEEKKRVASLSDKQSEYDEIFYLEEEEELMAQQKGADLDDENIDEPSEEESEEEEQEGE